MLGLIKPYVRFSRIRLSDHLLPEVFTDICLTLRHSFHQSSRIFSGVNSISVISFPSLLQKHDEGIAPSLSQSYVVFEMQAVLWATPNPLQTQWNFGLPYIHQLLSCSASARVSRATPYGFPCVSTLLPRESTYRLWQFSSG
jgi:hypothetical protein